MSRLFHAWPQDTCCCDELTYQACQYTIGFTKHQHSENIFKEHHRCCSGLDQIFPVCDGIEVMFLAML